MLSTFQQLSRFSELVLVTRISMLRYSFVFFGYAGSLMDDSSSSSLKKPKEGKTGKQQENVGNKKREGRISFLSTLKYTQYKKYEITKH